MLYKGTLMSRSVLSVQLMASAIFSAAQSSKEASSTSFHDRVAGLQKQDGFLPYYWDA
jgi:hypothetical protein